MSDSIETLNKITASAKNEFLEKGFKNASLRTIAHKAGVTTGAIYGYFKDKDAIFDALVRNEITELYDLINSLEGHEPTHFPTPEDFIKINKNIHIKYLDFVYKHFDECKLIFLCSSGSKLENFKDELLNYMININSSYIDYFSSKSQFKFDDFTLHLLTEFFFKTITELIEHNIPYDEAVQKTDMFLTFFFGGLNELLK